MITETQVLAAQNEWGTGVVKIGSLKDQRGECESFASDFLDKMYAFSLLSEPPKMTSFKMCGVLFLHEPKLSHDKKLWVFIFRWLMFVTFLSFPLSVFDDFKF